MANRNQVIEFTNYKMRSTNLNQKSAAYKMN